MKRTAPTEFLLISECVNRTVQGMWGNALQPQPVREIKQSSATFPLASGRGRKRRQQSCELTLCRGRCPSTSAPALPQFADRRSHVEPRRVPPELLKRLLPVRGGLPDHPTCVRRIAATDGPYGDTRLLFLRDGELVVRQSDFTDWYKHKRAKGNWPSQTNKGASRRGRPTKITGSLRNAILAVVHDGAWQATDGMPNLRRLLIERGYKPPSSDTLGRAMDQLHRLTGETSLRRTVRKPSGPGKRLASRKNRNLYS